MKRETIRDKFEECACMECGSPMYVGDQVIVDSPDWVLVACSPECLAKLSAVTVGHVHAGKFLERFRLVPDGPGPTLFDG